MGKRFFRRGLYCRFVVNRGYVPFFKKLIKSLKDGIDKEIPLSVYENGLAMRFFDPSRVMMADIKLTKYCFDEFELMPIDSRTKFADLPKTVYFNANDVLYALEGAKNSDAVFEVKAKFKSRKECETVVVRKPSKCPKCGAPTINNQLPPNKRGKDGNSYKCVCGWRGKVRRRKKKVKVERTFIDEPANIIVSVGDEKYDFNLLDYEYDDVPEPVFDFNAKAVVALKEFRKKLTKLAKRYDDVTLIATDDGLTVVGENDNSKGKLILSRASDMLLSIESYKEQKTKYNLKNLLCILPELGDIATIQFKTDMPLKTSIHADIDGQIDFYLAPLIV